MATRSRIAIENQDGSVKSIYCHWDGYPSNNGVILQKHYQDRKKVESLIKLGDISYLEERVEPTGPHSFDEPQSGVVVAYHRDRGEALQKASYHTSRSDYFKGDIEEYGYLFTKEGEWVYVESGGRLQPISCASIS